MIQPSHNSSTTNKMEIENMHPFCLPFSLCHDATSSSFVDDSAIMTEGSLAQDELDVFDLEMELDEFKLQFEDPGDKKDDWLPMSDDFLLLSPHTTMSNDIKSSPTLAQLNLNSNEDPSDGLWDSTTTTPTSATSMGRTPRSSATTSTLISPSVQQHRASSDLLISTPNHFTFNERVEFQFQRPRVESGANECGRPIFYRQGSFQDQRCQSPAPLVTSSCSPLSAGGGNENKLKENIDYLTVLLCNGSKKLDNKSTNQHPPPAPLPQQSGISSTMAKSYSTLAHSLSTGPKLLERYQIETQSRDQKPGNTQFVHGGNCYEKVDSSISAADSTGESHQLAQVHGPNQAYNTCYMNAGDSRASGMKVLSSLLSSSKTLPGQVYPPETIMSPALIQRPAVRSNWPMNATYNHNIYQHDPSASCISNSNVYNQQVSSSIPINGRPITLTPLVSNNVNIPSRPAAPASVPAPTALAKPRAGPTFIQPASPSTSSTTSSSGNTDNSSSHSTTANKRPKQNQSTPAISTDGSLSSHDEGFSSQVDQDDCVDSVRDSDDDGSDIDSDDESFYGDYTNSDLIGASISDNPECKWTLNMGRTRRNGQRRFFWQYNVQSKGPKGARVCSAESGENPFVLPEASDPVFSDECQIEGVKHSGKARRGDGNDLTPNPRKLLMIGLELKKLSKIINELAPVTDLPINARNKTRKEKNKLASRACRLKKKAQHEANKIKLYGLQREHQQVVMAIFDARKLIHKSLTTTIEPNPSDRRLSSSLRALLDQCFMTVAGRTGDYVNSVLEKVVSGCIDGGLQT